MLGESFDAFTIHQVPNLLLLLLVVMVDVLIRIIVGWLVVVRVSISSDGNDGGSD